MDLDIKISEEVLEAYQKVYLKEHAYAIFKADESKENVILDKEGTKDATFDQFKADLPENQPR